MAEEPQFSPVVCAWFRLTQCAHTVHLGQVAGKCWRDREGASRAAGQSFVVAMFYRAGALGLPPPRSCLVLCQRWGQHLSSGFALAPRGL